LCWYLETKHRPVNSTTQEDNDTDKIDKKQCDQLVITMPTVLKRRSLLDTGIDPEAINIDILGDDKLCGSVVLSPEDLRMLVRNKNSSFFLIHTNQIIS
jgi:hypothetical protein